MCNEFLQHNEFISKLERYEGQDERIYREIVSSACEKAYDYNYPLREVNPLIIRFSNLTFL